MKKIISQEEYLASSGKEFGPGEWFNVDQERINKFAEATEDYQFIHIDPVAAAETPFGTTIAHGFLTLSLLSKLVPDVMIYPENVAMGVNYGMNKLRFLSPVKVDSNVRVRCKIVSVEEKRPGQLLTTTEVTVDIEGEDKPALIVEWLTMVFLK